MKELINGTEICYQTAGEGDEKVLLLHGWGCDKNLMIPVADSLKSHFRTLVIDFPGHGESSRPPEPWGVQEYAENLHELLTKLSFTPCSVIAHSFGCRITAFLESKYPELFEKIVFTGAAGIRPRPTEESLKRTARFQKLKGYCERAGKIPLFAKAASAFEERLRQKYGSPDYNALDNDMRRTFVRIINQDLTDLYVRFQAPTLLIWGDEDTETPLWMAEEMKKRIPDAGLVILEGGTHFAYLEQLQRFSLIVKQFLKGDE